jgi:hypothetical protein
MSDPCAAPGAGSAGAAAAATAGGVGLATIRPAATAVLKKRPLDMMVSFFC